MLNPFIPYKEHWSVKHNLYVLKCKSSLFESLVKYQVHTPLWNKASTKTPENQAISNLISTIQAKASQDFKCGIFSYNQSLSSVIITELHDTFLTSIVLKKPN